MDIKTSNITEELKKSNIQLASGLFILQYSEMFNRKLSSFSDSTKHIIRNNKELNDLYDLFLDFIIDSSQHLDYIEDIEEVKLHEKEKMETL